MRKGFVLLFVIIAELLCLSACGTESHEHTIVIDYGFSPTCTEQGLTNGAHCLDCGEILDAQILIPASGHRIVADEGYLATGYTEGLTDGKHCSVCNEVLVPQEIIPVIPPVQIDFPTSRIFSPVFHNNTPVSFIIPETGAFWKFFDRLKSCRPDSGGSFLRRFDKINCCLRD